MVKNTCKLHQTSTKCWSIMLKFGQNKRWHILNLTEPVFKITSDITVLIFGNIGFRWPQIRFCGAALRYT